MKMAMSAGNKATTMIRLAILAFSVLILGSCSKPDCGCVTPPGTATTWKITKRFGGIAGQDVALTPDQENNRLLIRTDGTYSCTNIVTGITVTGTLTQTNFNSIYGNLPRFIFTPALPMLQDDYMILLDNPVGSIKFGDNIHDGYQTTFTLQ